MNQDKKKDKNFLPDDAESLLEGIHAIILDFRTRNSIPPTRFATSAGLNKNSLGVVEDKSYTDKGKRSTIDLLTLVKILNQYPELKLKIGRYLIGDNEENNTAATKEAAVYKREAEKFRKAADALARVNLISAQTITELTRGEVVE